MKLPSSWTYTTLAQLGGIVGGKTPSKAIDAYWKNGVIPWVSPKDMKARVLVVAQDAISESAVRHAGMTLLPAQTVLMVTRSGILQHTFPVARTNFACTINQDIKAWRPVHGLGADYVAYWLTAAGPKILESCSKAGIISMILTGSMKIPITKVPVLARALQVDAMALLRMVLVAYAPGLWETFEQVIGAERLVTANEFGFIKLVREHMGAVDVPLHEDVTFVAAMSKHLEKVRARFLGPASARRQPRGPAR